MILFLLTVRDPSLPMYCKSSPWPYLCSQPVYCKIYSLIALLLFTTRERANALHYILDRMFNNGLS